MDFWRLYFLIRTFSDLQAPQFYLYFKAFLIGFRLDAVIAGYLTLPVLLTIFLPWIGWASKIYRKIFWIYTAATLVLISFLNLVDANFFQEFGTHINILAVQRNAVQGDTLRYIWQEYHVIGMILAMAVSSFIMYKVLKVVVGRLKQETAGYVKYTAVFIFSLAALVTAVRGGWQERPINWGHAMFSNHEPANQIAMNGIFLLSRSVIELASEGKLDQTLSYYPRSEALDQVIRLISNPGESFIDSSRLVRKNNSGRPPIKPNIVLFILESHVGEFCGFINPEMKNVTPVLDSLANNGLMYTNCYANGKRSAYGISSIVNSWPTLPGYPLIATVEAQQDIQTAGTLLKGIGYDTIFLYGGDADFDNMKGFLRANGFDSILERKDFPAFTPGTKWGVFDHYVFEKSMQLLDQAQDPLLLTVFTTTNHQPFEIPEEYEDQIPFFDYTYRDGKTHRTMSYVDRSIGAFMAESKSRDWFDNTLFVFISDHGLNIHREMYEDPRNAHIPLVIYGPGIVDQPRVIDTLVSQADVLPTLLHLIGYSEPYRLFGRNTLADGPGFACRVANDHILWLERDILYIEDLKQSAAAYAYSSIYQQPYTELAKTDPGFSQIQKRCRSYLQTAYFAFGRTD